MQTPCGEQVHAGSILIMHHQEERGMRLLISEALINEAS